MNFIDKPDVNQSNIMLGHIGGLMNDPDYPALNIMNEILSFRALFKRVRSGRVSPTRSGGAYGADYIYPGTSAAALQTKSQSTVYAIDIMRRRSSGSRRKR